MSAAVGTRGRRLAPRARKALLTLHIGASVALIGSGAGITALSLIAIGEPAGDAHVIYTTARTLVFTLGIPLSFISLLSGIALGLGTRWGVLRHRWTAAKLGLQLAIIACGGHRHPPGHGLPDRRRGRGAVDDGGGRGVQHRLRDARGRPRGVQAGRAAAAGRMTVTPEPPSPIAASAAGASSSPISRVTRSPGRSRPASTSASISG